MRALSNYSFPGNVRELRNLIERAVTLGTGQQLELDDLPQEVREAAMAGAQEREHQPTLEERECEYIKQILEQTKGNKTRAAQILGIDRVSLWRKAKKFGLEP